MLYSSDISFAKIKSIFEKQTFFADIPGYITYSLLKEKIQEKQILPKDAILKAHTKMDGENYYILSKDFIDIKNIKKLLN
tara:strand:- start:127 stop:366 length:240 start_codon:yes stop_codon:yes gene_type:complete